MIKRIVHIIFSVAMSLLLMFGGVSKEYLHLYADHEDTVHVHNCADGLVFESEHHHCDFLAFTLMPFVHDAQSFQPTERVFYLQPQYKAVVAHLIPRAQPTSRLRGPPAQFG